MRCFSRCEVFVFNGRRSFSATPLRVLFFGSGKIAVESLDALNGNRKNPNPLISQLGVVVPPDRPSGRGAQIIEGVVKSYAKGNQLELVELPRDVNFRMDNWKMDLSGYDMGLVVSFGYFLPTWLIKSFPMGILNVHPSLLPKYRGAAPIQHTLINGDTETGVSIIRVDPEKIDAGELISQPRLAVEDTDTYESLYAKVAKVGAAEVLRVLEKWPNFTPQKQIGEVVKAPKIPNTYGRFEWKSVEAQKLHWKWRGIHGYTALSCVFRGKRLNIVLQNPFQRRTDESVAEGLVVVPDSPSKTLELKPGAVVYDGTAKTLLVRCAEGGWVGVDSVQIEHKQAIGAHAFANNYIRGLTPKNPGKFHRSDVFLE